MWHVWRKRELHTDFLLANLKKRDHLENLWIKRMMILKYKLKQ